MCLYIYLYIKIVVDKHAYLESPNRSLYWPVHAVPVVHTRMYESVWYAEFISVYILHVYRNIHAYAYISLYACGGLHRTVHTIICVAYLEFFMCVCICVCMYTYMYMYMYVSTYMYMWIYICMHMHSVSAEHSCRTSDVRHMFIVHKTKTETRKQKNNRFFLKKETNRFWIKKKDFDLLTSSWALLRISLHHLPWHMVRAPCPSEG